MKDRARSDWGLKRMIILVMIIGILVMVNMLGYTRGYDEGYAKGKSENRSGEVYYRWLIPMESSNISFTSGNFTIGVNSTSWK